MLVDNNLFDNNLISRSVGVWIFSSRTADQISVLFSINPGAPCYVAQVYVANPSYGCQKNRKKAKIKKK